MANLRDEMAQVIYESTTLNQHGETHALADELLALVREALTSDEAVKAAVRLTETPDIAHDAAVLGVTEEDIRGAEWKRAKDAITAALDAVTGEGKTG